MMKASEVIRIGRSRNRLASIAARTGVRPANSSSRANSTIRMAFLADNPTNTIRPICVKTLLSPFVSQTPNIAASNPMGTIMMIDNGKVRLSYCAASTRNTRSSATGNSSLVVFPVALLLVFLVLAAQYESLTLPLSIIMIVPMGLLAAMSGVWLTKGDNNVFTQIGLIVLVGLSAKNAILIVEFARELEFAGRTPVRAAIEASRLRLRPILMTSLAFIMGVVPLVTSTGAGSEMRHAMGVAVFSGMIGVTAFGIFFTPVFYVLLRALAGNRPLTQHGQASLETSVHSPAD